MTPDEQKEFDRRRKGRAVVTALILGGLAALFYFIAIAKMMGPAA